MKTAGIVRGIGPESTIEYYRQIVAAYRVRLRYDSYPSVIINSIEAQQARWTLIRPPSPSWDNGCGCEVM
jgi:aspartate/glutamate racemase